MSLPTNRQDGDIIENEDINAIAAEVNRVADDVGLRAYAGHGHSIDDVQELEARLLALESGSGTSVPGVPIFESLAEAQAWEADNPGVSAYYITVDDGLTHVVAAAPTFADPAGTASDAYTIPTSEGVIYKTGATVRAAGTYPGSGTVTITADPETGYAIDGARSWSHTFSTGAALTPVTPPTPTADDTTDRIIIPDVAGVTYKVDGIDAPPPFYAVGNVAGTVTVTAHEEPGYTLTGTASWEFTFTSKAADLPSNPYAIWSPADLPAVGASAESWEATVGGFEATLASGTAVVEGLSGGIKYVKKSGGGALVVAPGSMSFSGDMTIGVVFRIPDNGSLTHTSGPSIYNLTGATNVGLGHTQVSGQATPQQWRTRVTGGYVVDTPRPDLDWHRAVLVYGRTGTSLHFYQDDVLAGSLASTGIIGVETGIRLMDISSGPSLNMAAFVVYDRALDDTEAINLCGYLGTLTALGL